MTVSLGKSGQIVRNELLKKHLEEQANKFADKQLAPVKAALKGQADFRIDQSPSLNNKVKEFSKETAETSTNAAVDLSRRTLIAIAFSSLKESL